MKETSRKYSDKSYGTLLLICCGVAFVCYFGSYMRLPVVPIYAKSLGADAVQVGIINSAFFMMAAILSLPLGMVSDRIGRKMLASVGLLVLSGTSFLLYFSRSPLEIVWIYLLFGIGLAAFGPTMMSFVADFSPATHLGRSYGWYTTALYSGMTFGPAVGGSIAHALGFPNVFLISGAFILVTFFLVLLFLPSSNVAQSRAYAQRNLGEVMKGLLHNRPLMACWLATLAGCFGLGMFVTFLPLHAQNQGLNLTQIGLVFSAQGLCNALFRIPFGHLSDKVANRRDLIVLGLIGIVASVAGFGISKQLPHFLLFSLTLGASMALAFTSVGALIAEAVPQDQRGLAMGGYNTCIYFGMMLSSAFMGAVIRSIGFANGFLTTSAVNSLLTVIFYFLAKDYAPCRPDPGPGQAPDGCGT